MKGAIDASLRAGSSGREAGIDAALDYFYSGPVAEQAVKFSSNNAFADDPGARTRACSPWTTSPTTVLAARR